MAGLILKGLVAKSQLANKSILTGIWTEKQNGHASLQWLFEGKNDFAEISYWANGQELGGNVSKGKFIIDTLLKTIKLNFNTTFSIRDNTFDNNSSHQEWKIVKVGNDEIVISRPPVWKDEKPNKIGDNKNIYVTLVRLTKPVTQIQEAVTLK